MSSDHPNQEQLNTANAEQTEWFRERLLGHPKREPGSLASEREVPEEAGEADEQPLFGYGDEDVYGDDIYAVPSLRSYISQRIFENAPQPLKPPSHDFEIRPSVLPEPVQEERVPDHRAVNGNHINSLDTQFTAGLEQFLPTPSIRLRIIQERLSREIQALASQIKKYEVIVSPPPDVATKLQSMRARYQNLIRHDAAIEKELSQLVASQNAWMFGATQAGFQVGEGLSMVWKALTGWIQPRAWAEKLDPKRFEMIALNRRLSSLHEVMADQMKQVAPSSVEMSTLVNQYDQTLKQLEHLSSYYKKRQNWREEWGEQLMKQVRKLYT